MRLGHWPVPRRFEILSADQLCDFLGRGILLPQSQKSHLGLQIILELRRSGIHGLSNT